MTNPSRAKGDGVPGSVVALAKEIADDVSLKDIDNVRSAVLAYGAQASEKTLRQLGHSLRWLHDATDNDMILNAVIAILFPFHSNFPIGSAAFGVWEHAARWAGEGFPTLALTPKETAGLALSDPPDDAIGSLNPPWRAFVIRIPPDTVNIGENVSVRRIAVSHRDWGGLGALDGPWVVRVDTSRKEHLWEINRTTGQLSGGEFAGAGKDPGAGVPISDHEKRVSSGMARLAVSAIDAVTNLQPKMVRSNGGKQSRRASGSAKPKATEYVLGLPVRIDARQWLNDYLSHDGERARRCVRWVTRGHWRMQPHGPRKSLRKRRWIEPHWNNRNNDAPVLVRDHQLSP